MMSREEFLALNVGDEFTVSDDAEEESNLKNEVGRGPGWDFDMDHLPGKTLEVASVDREIEYVRAIDEFGNHWAFTRRMIETADKVEINTDMEVMFA